MSMRQALLHPLGHGAGGLAVGLISAWGYTIFSMVAPIVRRRHLTTRAVMEHKLAPWRAVSSMQFQL